MKQQLESIIIKGRDGKPQIIQVLRPVPVKCKTCGLDDRRQTSAYCQSCADKYKSNEKNKQHNPQMQHT